MSHTPSGRPSSPPPEPREVAQQRHVLEGHVARGFIQLWGGQGEDAHHAPVIPASRRQRTRRWVQQRGGQRTSETMAHWAGLPHSSAAHVSAVSAALGGLLFFMGKLDRNLARGTVLVSRLRKGGCKEVGGCGGQEAFNANLAGRQEGTQPCPPGFPACCTASMQGSTLPPWKLKLPAGRRAAAGGTHSGRSRKTKTSGEVPSRVSVKSLSPPPSLGASSAPVAS